MKRLIAIIEKGESDGYCIYAANGEPLFANGMTEKEAKDDFFSLVPEQAEYIKEKTGSYPEWYSKDMEIEFRYDMTAFFEAFPFINATELAKAIGINPSLMRRYKSGISKAGEKQKNLIQTEFDKIISRMASVRF